MKEYWLHISGRKCNRHVSRVMLSSIFRKYILCDADEIVYDILMSVWELSKLCHGESDSVCKPILFLVCTADQRTMNWNKHYIAIPLPVPPPNVQQQSSFGLKFPLIGIDETTDKHWEHIMPLSWWTTVSALSASHIAWFAARYRPINSWPRKYHAGRGLSFYVCSQAELDIKQVLLMDILEIAWQIRSTSMSHSEILHFESLHNRINTML